MATFLRAISSSVGAATNRSVILIQFRMLDLAMERNCTIAQMGNSKKSASR